MPSTHLPQVKIATFLGFTAGLTLFSILAIYLRRKRGSPNTSKSKPRQRILPHALTNGDVPRGSASNASSPSQPSRRRRTRTTSRSSSVAMASNITLVNETDTSEMQPQQLCQLGLEYLHKAVEFWEDAYSKSPSKSTEDSDENENSEASSELKTQLRVLLKKAYGMEDEHRHLIEYQLNRIVLDRALSASIDEMKIKYAAEEDGDSDDLDSFVSAPEFVEMTESQQQKLATDFPMYHAGMLEVKHGSVPCRTLRTQTLQCSSDADFLAKLFCVRLAFRHLFKDETILRWFISKGREMVTNVLQKADKDPSDFQAAFDDMITYTSNESNASTMTEELKSRGVKDISFYDVVLDFVFLDAFVEMENPPSSVTTIVQNRWLSNGFKETALSTAVWSVLKAKKRMIKYSDGFIAHFYDISETVSPTLAWGFLGPIEELNELCDNFKDQLFQFMEDIFSIERVRYTTVEELAEDIYQVAQEKSQILSEQAS